MPETSPDILPENIPQHIAIIMDGNGRWAKSRGQNRVFGHHEGVLSVRAIVNACGELGVKFLTLYAFSTENWSRPKAEVDALMELLVTTLQKELEELYKNQVRLRVIGNFEDLPHNCKVELQAAIENTKNNTGLTLILALSYSARLEIATACKRISEKVLNGEMTLNEIDETAVANHLYTADIPEPELVIRTSGEHRVSNFLLYQLAYAELYFTNTNWPDFRKEHLLEAITDYNLRERRFGKTSEQIQKQD